MINDDPVNMIGGKKAKIIVVVKQIPKMRTCKFKTPLIISADAFFLSKYQLRRPPKRNSNERHTLTA
jgi:hypothetical protein